MFWELLKCMAGIVLRTNTKEMISEAKAWWRVLTLKIRLLKSNLESSPLG